MAKTKVRQAIDNYNERVAEHLAYYMHWNVSEILDLINLMPDNNDNYKD